MSDLKRIAAKASKAVAKLAPIAEEVLKVIEPAQEKYATAGADGSYSQINLSAKFCAAWDEWDTEEGGLADAAMRQAAHLFLGVTSKLLIAAHNGRWLGSLVTKLGGYAAVLAGLVTGRKPQDVLRDE